MGFDFTVIAPLLPSHCGFSFVFGFGVSFFGEFQCLPVDDCPAASCDSGGLTRGSESTSFYSAVLVQGPKDGIFRNVFGITFKLIFSLNKNSEINFSSVQKTRK